VGALPPVHVPGGGGGAGGVKVRTDEIGPGITRLLVRSAALSRQLERSSRPCLLAHRSIALRRQTRRPPGNTAAGSGKPSVSLASRLT
jgi:hypothetical protein